MTLNRKDFLHNRTESYLMENILGFHSVNSLLIHYAFLSRVTQVLPLCPDIAS
jgi:hypothetical protein